MKFLVAMYPHESLEFEVAVTADDFLQKGIEAVQLQWRSKGRYPYGLILSHKEFKAITEGHTFRDLMRFAEVPGDGDPLSFLGYVFGVRTVAVIEEVESVDPEAMRKLAETLLQRADEAETAMRAQILKA